MTITKMEIDINFYVYGYDLDPDKVTNVLQLQPCATGRRGVQELVQRGSNMHHSKRAFGVTRSGVLTPHNWLISF